MAWPHGVQLKVENILTRLEMFDDSTLVLTFLVGGRCGAVQYSALQRSTCVPPVGAMCFVLEVKQYHPGGFRV